MPIIWSAAAAEVAALRAIPPKEYSLYGFENYPAERIFAFQFSDVPNAPPSTQNRPTDRLPPGKGKVRWREVFELIAEKGYKGYLSYEAPNPDYWARPPLEVAREAVEATRALLAGR